MTDKHSKKLFEALGGIAQALNDEAAMVEASGLEVRHGLERLADAQRDGGQTEARLMEAGDAVSNGLFDIAEALS